MSGLYDYPGEYLMRFDGVDGGEWCGYFASWNPSQSSPSVKIQKLRVTAPRGIQVFEMWQKSTTRAGGPPKTFTVEKVSRSSVPAARWRVRNARPIKWSAGPTASKNEVAIETLEITHQGILPIP